MQWEIIKNFIICVFEVYMLMEWAACLLARRESKIYICICMVAGIILLTIIGSCNNPNLNLLCVPLIDLLIISVTFKGTAIRKVCTAASYYAILIIPEFICAVLISVSRIQDYQTYIENGINEIAMLLIVKNITFVLVKIIGRHFRKKDFTAVKDKIFALMMFQPMATLTILISIFYADIHAEEIGKNLLLLGTVLLLFSNVFVFYVFDRLIFNMDKAKKMEVLYTKSQAEKTHFEYLEKVTNQHYEILHDIKKYIRTACELIQEKETEQAIQLFSGIEIKIDESQDFYYTSNKILNAILNERKIIAQKKHLRYSAKVQENIEDFVVKDIDIIAILGNLIDNAIEAAVQTENGYVDIKIYTGNNDYFMIWEVKNNFIHEPKQKGNRFITRKQNTDEHGIGLHTVEKLVLQYGGMLQTKIIEKEFIASIVFSIE